VTAQVWISGVVGIAAIVDDLARRRISNWIPGSAFAAGLILQTVQGGWRGTGAALLGTAAGAGVFLVFYLLGGMGGGDVKLMAGFGAVLGVKRLLEAALWTAGCGGLMAAVVIAAGYVRQIGRSNRAAEVQSREVQSQEVQSREVQSRDVPSRDVPSQDVPSLSAAKRRRDSIPYAPAIAAGVWLSLVPKT
jgi:prepilin peptidase CpaA